MVSLQAILKSVIFHVTLVAVFLFSIPFLSRDIAPEQPTLTVDIVNTVPQTNLDEGVKAKPTADPEPAKEVDTPVSYTHLTLPTN